MDVTKLTSEQTRNILDFVLENSYHPEDYFDFKNKILPKLISEKLFPDEDEYLLQMALNQLKRDGYIDFIDEAPNNKIKNFNDKRSAGENLTIRRNFAGHIFLANGGYKEDDNRRIIAATNESAYNGRMETYSDRLATWTTRLTYATWLAGASAALLLLWDMRHWIASHFSCS